MLLELTLEDIDTVVYGFLEAISLLLDEEIRTTDVELDRSLLVVCHLRLDDPKHYFSTLDIIGKAIKLLELPLNKLLELLASIEVQGLNANVHNDLSIVPSTRER